LPGTPRRIVLILGTLTAFAPLSTTIYLPALPSAAEDLGASASEIQLTITALVAGIAAGQLIAGPLSDRFGRRCPLLVGIALYAGASLACAVAPSTGALIAARLAQGLAGAAGIVIGRAIVRDLHSGAAAARLYSVLVLVTGMAPVVAPLIGGQILAIGSWRSVFVALAGIGVLVWLAVALGLPETLPPERRHARGAGETIRTLGRLFADRRLVGYALACGLAYAALLSYISGSSFVLQNVYGASPQTYSVVFAIIALGLMVASQFGARLVGRLGPRRLLAIGVATSATGGCVALLAVVAGLGLAVLLPAMVLTVSSHGIVLPSATALALTDHPEAAGSASAALGLVQYTTGGIAAPTVGLGGEHTAVPMAMAMAVLGIASMIAPALLAPARPYERGVR
jgi:DHA1 family bicyclomycin/chloramphenicol resistance-like MFS transporter